MGIIPKGPPGARLSKARQREILLRWYAGSVALTMHDDKLRAELEAWERENLGLPFNLGTSDWPGWAQTAIGPKPHFTP